MSNVFRLKTRLEEAWGNYQFAKFLAEDSPSPENQRSAEIYYARFLAEFVEPDRREQAFEIARRFS